MDLKDKLDELSGRIKRQLEHVKTEEAVKTAFILPFFKRSWLRRLQPSRSGS